jgi:hypothetical protein
MPLNLVGPAKNTSTKGGLRMRKFIPVFYIVLFFSSLFPATVNAQAVEASSVWGNRYNCFFYSNVDVFNSELIFSDQISFSLSRFNGAGYYFAFINSFVGIYNAVDATIGGKTSDIVIILSGLSRGFFVFGTGVIIIDYFKIYPMFFQGLIIEEEAQP